MGSFLDVGCVVSSVRVVSAFFENMAFHDSKQGYIRYAPHDSKQVVAREAEIWLGLSHVQCFV